MNKNHPIVNSTAPSINLNTNSTEVLKINETLITNSLTDGFATIKDGYLKHLTIPPDTPPPSSAATKFFVDNFDESALPGGPDGSIQYRNDQVFAGSANFMFDPNTGTTEVEELKVGSAILFKDNRIQNVLDPQVPSDVATKKYVDDNIFIKPLVPIWLMNSVFSTSVTLTYNMLRNTSIRNDYRTSYLQWEL